MKKTWNAVSWKIIKAAKDEKESKLLKLNSNKAKEKLKWQTTLNFRETIKMTIDWYKNFYDKKNDNYNFSINQISNYLQFKKKRI